jgi:hypothetical protein
LEGANLQWIIEWDSSSFSESFSEVFIETNALTSGNDNEGVNFLARTVQQTSTEFGCEKDFTIILPVFSVEWHGGGASSACLVHRCGG